MDITKYVVRTECGYPSVHLLTSVTRRQEQKWKRGNYRENIHACVFHEDFMPQNTGICHTRRRSKYKSFANARVPVSDQYRIYMPARGGGGGCKQFHACPDRVAVLLGI